MRSPFPCAAAFGQDGASPDDAEADPPGAVPDALSIVAGTDHSDDHPGKADGTSGDPGDIVVRPSGFRQRTRPSGGGPEAIAAGNLARARAALGHAEVRSLNSAQLGKPPTDAQRERSRQIQHAIDMLDAGRTSSARRLIETLLAGTDQAPTGQ